MKLLSEVINYNNIEKYALDIIIINSKEFGIYSPYSISKELLAESINKIKQLKRKVAIKMDRLINENDLSALEDYIDYLLQFNIDYYIFSDFSIFYLAKTKKLDAQAIYNSKTINCSLNDALYYKLQAIDIVISQELELVDIVKTLESKNVGIEVYGHPLVFYSARKLLSAYRKNYEIKDNKNKETIYQMQDRTTKMWFYLVENDFGTFIYNEKRYLIYKEIGALKQAKYFFINSLFLNEEDLLKTINIYRMSLKTEISEELYYELVSIYPNISSGFLYKKPLILEEGQNEKN